MFEVLSIALAESVIEAAEDPTLAREWLEAIKHRHEDPSRARVVFDEMNDIVRVAQNREDNF